MQNEKHVVQINPITGEETKVSSEDVTQNERWWQYRCDCGRRVYPVFSQKTGNCICFKHYPGTNDTGKRCNYYLGGNSGTDKGVSKREYLYHNYDSFRAAGGVILNPMSDNPVAIESVSSKSLQNLYKKEKSPVSNFLKNLQEKANKNVRETGKKIASLAHLVIFGKEGNSIPFQWLLPKKNR